jgi:hypothetical protein
MPAKSRRWQTRIEIDEHTLDECQLDKVVLYGETIEALRSTVKAYLLEKKPSCFSNIGDNFVGQTLYFYSRGLSTDDPIDSSEGERRKRGWWVWRSRPSLELVEGEPSENHPEQALPTLEGVVNSFVQRDLIFEKGPDYQSKAVIRGHLQLPLIEKILRETAEHPINDLIRRGWHIIALEYKGELSTTGELTNRNAIFVMGHPEDEAASLTLNMAYFKEIQSKAI